MFKKNLVRLVGQISCSFFSFDAYMSAERVSHPSTKRNGTRHVSTYPIFNERCTLCVLTFQFITKKYVEHPFLALANECMKRPLFETQRRSKQGI